MADIDVVPRKGGMSWMIWVVLALIVLAVIWMMMGRGTPDPGVGYLSPAAIPFAADINVLVT